MSYSFVLHIQMIWGKSQEANKTVGGGGRGSGVSRVVGPCSTQKEQLLLRSRSSLPYRGGLLLRGDTGWLPHTICQVKMEIQTSMLNLLALKFWQLMETYAENSDYLVTRHIPIVLEMILSLFLVL